MPSGKPSMWRSPAGHGRSAQMCRVRVRRRRWVCCTQRQQQKTNSFKRLAIISTVEFRFITERLFFFLFIMLLCFFLFFFHRASSGGLPPEKNIVSGEGTQSSACPAPCAGPQEGPQTAPRGRSSSQHLLSRQL